MKNRPLGNVFPTTGYVGFIVLLTSVLIFRGDPLYMGDLNSGLFCLILAAGSMVIIEAFVLWKSSGNGSNILFLSPSFKSLLDGMIDKDLLIKIYGQFIIFGFLWATYKILPIYQSESYVVVMSLLKSLFPTIISVTVLYLWITHIMLLEKRDALWNFGCYFLFLNRKELSQDKISSCILSWIIKGFFWPLMMSYFLTEWQYMAHNLNWMNMPSDYRLSSSLFEDLYRFLYFIDLSFAIIGYSLSLRLLNTQIIMPDKSIKGWVICLICYAPFWPMISQNYINYWDNISWGSILYEHPALYTIWGSAILLVISFYVYATVCFGLRFSNLTHRGIVTHGPYALIKHPAYISKNLSWWMIELPFLAASPVLAIKNCAMLLAINLIYYYRAKTEERLLRQDPIYVDYCERMDRKRFPRLLRRP
jgi:protein-S-isoprenylcysteine O-methyltransferase Ste14